MCVLEGGWGPILMEVCCLFSHCYSCIRACSVGQHLTEWRDSCKGSMGADPCHIPQEHRLQEHMTPGTTSTETNISTWDWDQLPDTGKKSHWAHLVMAPYLLIPLPPPSFNHWLLQPLTCLPAYSLTELLTPPAWLTWQSLCHPPCHLSHFLFLYCHSGSSSWCAQQQHLPATPSGFDCVIGC